MSIATRHRPLFDTSQLDATDRARTSAPVLRARTLAALRRAALDRRLADGADTTHSRALTARAWQITRRSARERLATGFDRVLVDAARPQRERSARVPVCRAEVEVARGELLRLVERLRDARPVDPRGVALALRLLTDGTSPLYGFAPNDELLRQVRRAVAALD